MEVSIFTNVFKIWTATLYALRKKVVLQYGAIRLSFKIYLFTEVTTCCINFNFTDIFHLLCLIHSDGNGPCNSFNKRIMIQLLIFAFGIFLS